MSDDLRYVQELGRKSEGLTPGTDPITDGAETFFQFGQYNKSWGKFPELVTDIIKSLTGTSYDPRSFNVGKTQVMGNVASVVTDGLGLYYSLCKQETDGGEEDGGVADDGGGAQAVYTITPIEPPLDIQSYTTRFHDKNTDTADIQKSIPLCRTQQYTMSLDNSTPNKLPLAQTESFVGQKVQAVAAGTSDYTLQLADSLNTLFYWSNDANSLFTWDYGGDNVELRNSLRSIAFTVNTGILPIWISGQHYYKYVPGGSRIMVLTAEFEARNETSVFDDYMSQAGTTAVPADIFKAARFKISNANSKYIQLDFNELGITNLSRNHAWREGDQIPTYQLQAEVRTVSPVIKDGITTLSHYGISV